MPMGTRHPAVGALACALGFAIANAAPAVAQDPVVAAAGDIACAPSDSGYNAGAGSLGPVRCHQRSVSDLFVGRGLAGVLALGDLQFETGTLKLFNRVFDDTWGRVKPLIRPVPGNHDYDNPAGGARGYFDYFNGTGGQAGQAGDRAKGWYSFDVGTWHVIALNSNCSDVDGICDEDSEQLNWLRADLAANPRDCTLAYWHHPRFSSGDQEDGRVRYMWRALDEADADVALVAHDHIYERFAPQTDGGMASTRGVRQFSVGTGGKSLRPEALARGPRAANSQVVQATTTGPLFLTLRAGGYDWDFAGAAGGNFDDRGRASCVTPGQGAQDLPRPPSGSAKLGIATRRARASRRGVVKLRTRCKGAVIGSCRGTVGLRARRGAAILGKSLLAVPTGRTATVSISLNSRGRRLLRRTPKLRTRLGASYRVRGGPAKRVKRDLVLSAARR